MLVRMVYQAPGWKPSGAGKVVNGLTTGEPSWYLPGTSWVCPEDPGRANLGNHLPGTYRVGPLPGTSLSTMRSKRANIAWVIRTNTCFVARPDRGLSESGPTRIYRKGWKPGATVQRNPGQLTRHLPGIIRVTHS